MNFNIQFSHPWLLFLIIPLIAFALILFFRVNKKFRRNRNRIISLVLHCVVSVLCVFVLSGIQFNYSIPNETNELLLLVDVSDSEEQVQENRDEYVDTILRTGMYDGISMGVVTFGFDQNYVVPFTDDIASIYPAYAESIDDVSPDKSGTDIAAALTYAADLFQNPASGKIVLVTDAKETDEDAMQVIRSISSRGIGVDTVYISSGYSAQDVQVTSVEYPDYHLNVEDEFNLSYTLQSNTPCEVIVNIYDNGSSIGESQRINVAEGEQTFSWKYAFQSEGLHEIRVAVETASDLIEENNSYSSYYYLEKFDKVLIIEQEAGASAKLETILEDDGDYDVTVLNLNDADIDIPTDVAELCEYDQIIMNNIANSDMPVEFVDLLYSYVYDYGGGLFTVGGTDETGEAHAYNRNDMYGTTYQSMLPVQAINYTPPVAVMIIIDTSGSMSGQLEWARAGASACLDALTERDYVGLMTLSDQYDLILPLTSRTQDMVIRDAIGSISESNGGTIFSDSVRRAALALRAQTNVAKRHIIIVSDGAISQDDYDAFVSNVNEFYTTDQITLSIVGVNMSDDIAEDMRYVCEDLGGGRLHVVNDSETLVREMREDLNAPEIKDVNIYEDGFHPIAFNAQSNLFDGVELENDKMTATLGGFYGVKVRDEDYMILAGDYNVPLYAQWKFGAGSVGSFMCDLSGSGWSANFMTDAGGKQFILNVINSLMPVEDIEPDPFNVKLETGNYINELSVFADLESGQYVRGQLVSPDGSIEVSLNSLAAEDELNPDAYVTFALDSSSNYSRCTFVLKRAGVYSLMLDVCDANGNVIASYQQYLEFSYSDEYDKLMQTTSVEDMELLSNLASIGNGSMIISLDDVGTIFETFETSIHKTYDPRIPILVIAIILFLLDVAVRKFKFKWIHEIVREKRAQNKGSGN